MSHIFGNQDFQLRLSERNGAIESITFHGTELAAPSPGMFTLRMYLHETGDYRFFQAEEFPKFRREGELLLWSGHPEAPEFTVGCRITFDGEFFRFSPSLRNLPEEMWADLIEMPQLSVPLEKEIFWPHGPGCLIREPWKSFREYHHAGFPGNSDPCVYPGSASVQFLAAYGSRYGLYYAADDPTHSIKTMEIGPAAGSSVRLRIECTCDRQGMEQEFELPFDLVVGAFEGDWMDACEIYRRWMKHDPIMKRDFALPDWMEESPVVIIYPVCGDGRITPEPNRFLPYERNFTRLQELSAALDSPLLVLLMRWDHNGPWMPPYYWPPVGGEESFLTFCDKLHKAGHRIGLYGSGTLYTRKSRIHDYSTEEEYRKRGLERFMARGPKGEVDARICSNIRQGTELCITEPWCVDVMCEQVKLVAEHGVDFFQILDQNHGGESFVCYARDHHHPPLPGVWQTRAMAKLIETMRRTAAATGNPLLIGCENVAAAPYVAQMPFNDRRNPLVYGQEANAVQYLFHEYANNFLGNESSAWETIRCADSPDNLQLRLAMSFVRGEYLSFTLRDSGEIDWGAAADWSAPAPEQQPVLTLAKQCNAFRRKYRKFLLHGTMQKPSVRLECGWYELKLRKRDSEFLPLVPTGAFRAPDGEEAQFLVNFRNRPEPVRLRSDRPFTLETGESRTQFPAGESALELPPLSCGVLLFSHEKED